MRNTPGLPEESKHVHTTVRRFSDIASYESIRKEQEVNKSAIESINKTLYMTESYAKPKQSKFSKNSITNKHNPVLVLKEKKNKNLRIYHI
jgi:hypothetical protein